MSQLPRTRVGGLGRDRWKGVVALMFQKPLTLNYILFSSALSSLLIIFSIFILVFDSFISLISRK